jgi:hypothetical protein
MKTINDLFKEAGFDNYLEMKPMQPYTPKKNIEVKSYDIKSKNIVWSKVNALFYKGLSNPSDSYLVSSVNNKFSFKCTGSHLVWTIKGYVPVKNCINSVTSINGEGYPVALNITPIQESFPILDIEVEGTNNYFSGNILSHNSFGGTAKVFAEGLKKLNPILSRYETSMILINQLRAKIGGFSGFGPPEHTAGGYAPKYFASWRGKVSKADDILDKTEVIGNTIKVRNVKSKIGFPKRSAILDLYYGTGFNPEAEYLDFIIDLGLVTKKGSWLSQEEWGFKGQGQASLLEFLQNNKEIFDKCKKDVNDLFSKHSMLDDNEAPDPEAEEELNIIDSIGGD